MADSKTRAELHTQVQVPETSRDEGVVLGSLEATPLEFWIGVAGERMIQLDDLVVSETTTPDGQMVRFYGVVDVVRKKYEGASFDNDAFRVTAGTLPADISYAAHVQVTRIDPEIFIPPHPGGRAWVVRGEDFQKALYFDTMATRIPIGLTRTGGRGLPCRSGAGVGSSSSACARSCPCRGACRVRGLTLGGCGCIRAAGRS